MIMQLTYVSKKLFEQYVIDLPEYLWLLIDLYGLDQLKLFLELYVFDQLLAVVNELLDTLLLEFVLLLLDVLLDLLDELLDELGLLAVLVECALVLWDTWDEWLPFASATPQDTTISTTRNSDTSTILSLLVTGVTPLTKNIKYHL